MGKYEQLKKVIQEANPEIMELKFGCEVVVDGIREDNPGCERDIVTDERIKDGHVVLGYFGKVPLSKIRIIGRPIRFADVLLSLRKNIGYIPVLGVLDTLVSKWRLEDDDLDHQSDETKQLLIGLLVK